MLTDISEKRVASIFKVGGGSTFIRNVDEHLPHSATSQTRVIFNYTRTVNYTSIQTCNTDVELIIIKIESRTSASIVEFVQS
jgi:hypothetical protein